MRCVIQRVSSAKVEIAGETVGAIEAGIMVLVCAMQGDTEENAARLAKKVAALRIFSDDQGKMNKSVIDVAGAALVISQFTLAADTSRGNRPGFSSSAPPEIGEHLYKKFCDHLAEAGIPVQTGRFAADMQVSLVNDGPVTIMMEF